MKRILSIYLTPLINVILSRSRLKKVPQDDFYETFLLVVIAVASQLSFIAAVPLCICAKLFTPAPKPLVYAIISICFIISYFTISSIKTMLTNLIQEANRLTKEQHRKRRKDLLLKFTFAYALTPIYLIVICILFDYLKEWLT